MLNAVFPSIALNRLGGGNCRKVLPFNSDDKCKNLKTDEFGEAPAGTGLHLWVHD